MHKIRQEYPLHLKRGDRIHLDGRVYKVHRADFWEKERGGVFHNVVGVETTTGYFITLPVSRVLEVYGK